MKRQRKTDKEVIEEIEEAKEIIKEVKILEDELQIVETDTEEQKRLKAVFIGFRRQNPKLWERDKIIYLEKING